MIHKPVMIDEIVSIFAEIPTGVFVDATYGLGGHTKALKKVLRNRCDFIGIDRDGEVLNLARSDKPESVKLRKLNFTDIPSMVTDEGISPLTGILFDLGLNSVHIDYPVRGFSYRTNAPLDLRFDRDSGRTAADIIARLDEKSLVRILKDYGQEKKARAIARAIVDQRPSTTEGLAAIIRRVSGSGEFNKSAARVFQALRIFVNDELTDLDGTLRKVIPLIAEGGRIAVISYHSLEDGITKRVFALYSGKCQCGPEVPECRCGKRRILEVKTKKPMRPSSRETAENSRARAARLRYAERIEEKA